METVIQPPRPKAAFKIPMSQTIVTVNGQFWKWGIVEGKVNWQYFGSCYIDKN